MGRLLNIWRSWSVRRRRLTVVGVLVALCAAGGLIAYLSLKRPGDVLNEDAEFVPPKHQRHQKPETTNWPIYGYDRERTRYLPANDVKPPFAERLWKFDAGRLLEFSPILVRGDLYVMDKAAVMYSLRAKTGRVNWKRQIGSLNASAPAYYKHRLFASTLEPGEIVAMNADNGRVLWRHPLPGRTETSPLVYQHKVLVGCECGDVMALDPKTGQTRWTVHTAGAVKGGVAVHDGVAFIGNYAGQLFAIRVADGSVKWQTDSLGSSFGRSGRFYSTPAVAYGRVYAGNIDGRVYSFVEDTGQLAWSHSTGAEVYAGPAVADTPGAPPTVFIGSADHNFYALDAKSGALRWQHTVGSAVLGAASVVGRIVYVGVIGDNIGTFGYDTGSGDEVFHSPYGEYNPVISDSHLLYLTGSSKILALEPVSRKEKRKEARRQAARERKQRHRHNKGK